MHAATAAPLLRCELSQGGETAVLEAAPDPDPYRRHSVNVFDRFLFKAVVAGDAGRVDYIKLYAYFPGNGQPMLLQEALYRAPQPQRGDDPYALTGNQRLYSPAREYELFYGCALKEAP